MSNSRFHVENLSQKNFSHLFSNYTQPEVARQHCLPTSPNCVGCDLHFPPLPRQLVIQHTKTTTTNTKHTANSFMLRFQFVLLLLLLTSSCCRCCAIDSASIRRQHHRPHWLCSSPLQHTLYSLVYLQTSYEAVRAQWCIFVFLPTRECVNSVN